MMTNSIHAPEQSSRFASAVTMVLGATVGAIAGMLAFAPFFIQITA